MRVTTNQQFYSGQQTILKNQANLHKLQNQLSTGRKVVNPSDDPVASSRALLASQSKNVNAQYMNNQSIAMQQLSMTDSVLGSMSNTLQSILSSSVQAGDGAYSDAERRSIAAELRQQLNGLVDLANSKTATGEYVFGGYRTTEPPVVVYDDYETAGDDTTPYRYAKYNGDGGNQRIYVESSTAVNITENGSEVFMRILDKHGNPTGDSVFDTVKKMIDYLETTNAPNTATGKADYNKALGDLNSVIEHVSRNRASVGARQAMVSELNASSRDLAVQYDTALSELQDLDYAEAITSFTLQQTQLQAAQQSFLKVTESNLFSYL